MSHKTVEVKIDEEVYALVKKAAESGRHGKACTIPEMASDLVTTGIYRRIAANKWAKAHAAPKKARKPKPPKAKKAAAPKPEKKAPAKPKVKRAPKVKTPEPAAPPPPVQEPAAAAPPASLLE